MNSGPFTEITDLLERAARNGTRAHLNHDLVRALIASEAYSLLLADRKKEIISTWQDNEEALPRPGVRNSGSSGSGIAATEMTGASAGTMTADQTASVGLAASRQASAAVAQITHRKKRKTP
ncbi:hypothetical protein YP76_10140 [Sphingobium chungbukense]|uniref:Uncharacterized protein n=1 Tax=Sphingobium chungbukense TaxID=56193 RepID=A0A0M3ATL6_9SPHN|nr:hypothetical protein YP76_10140 [Sphingobium chungbukense]